ncbi:MAG: TIGR00299 family protein [Phycisphaeraceae bacterium]|nr:TIGR00299 family protein [Phycisphaeraceae bacterium]
MIGHFDLPAGLSGDMFLACLVDAGLTIDALRASVRRLGLPGDEWSMTARQVMKGPLRATLVEVDAKAQHHHRGLADVERMIEPSDLPRSVRDRSIEVFRCLAAAEAAVHGTTIERVHFHEVGALDAIIDIVGAVAGLEALGIQALFSGPVPLGEGWVDTMHGRLPVPAPATLEILSRSGAPTRPSPGPGECLTPTGAALVCTLASFETPSMRIERVGVGAGRRDCAWPNVARLCVGTAATAATAGAMIEIATNVDDMNPQHYDAVRDHLFAVGARDVWMTPIQMKKGRPGVLLSVLATSDREAALVDLLLRETTTLGVRIHPVRRHEAEREMGRIETSAGGIRIKLKRIDGEIVDAVPEHDDCRTAAETAGLPVRRVYDEAMAEARRLVRSDSDGRNGDRAESSQ